MNQKNPMNARRIQKNPLKQNNLILRSSAPVIHSFFMNGRGFFCLESCNGAIEVTAILPILFTRCFGTYIFELSIKFANLSNGTSYSFNLVSHCGPLSMDL